MSGRIMSGSISQRIMSGSISRRSWSMEGVFSRRHSRTVDEDEEALKWAAIEKLPTYERLRTSIIKSIIENEHQQTEIVHREVDVRKLDVNDRQNFISNVFKVAEEDNEKFLKKYRKRIDRVGIQLPKVEVRFEHLTVEANCYIGSRALPTLANAAKNSVEWVLGMLGISFAKRTKLKILKDASGIKNHQGPPSSGKTTLLLALAGKLDSNLKTTGEITYNGYKLNEFVPRKTSAYISQNDVHVGVMTVKETLDFSARCQGVGTRYDLQTELASREKQAGIYPEAELDLFMKATAVNGMESNLITDYTLKILGLDICKDTIVGDEMLRGISGGQKKRVTTGEMIVGPTKTLFMDEISTGLDSSTTYQIVKCLQQIVHLTDATVLMSLLQPAPETFDLFDDIILLSEGQIVYQGPRECVLNFFESCGFRCPERKGTADFLQEVTSRKDQKQYWADRSMPYRYVSVAEFVEKFKRFHVGMQLKTELSTPFDKSLSHRAALVFTKYSVPRMQLLKACWDKEWLLIKRNAFVYVSKAVQLIIVAFIASTVFLRTKMHTRNEDDGGLYISALTFSVIHNMFNGYAELSLMISRLPVFYKHRDLLFHPAWTFTLPTFLLMVPISIIESIVWVVIAYFTIGFASEAGRFFKHLALVFLTQQMAAGIFRLIAGLCRTMIIANTGGAFALLLFSCLEVSSYLKASDNVTRLGVAVLENFDIFTDDDWYWIGAVALVGFTIVSNPIHHCSHVLKPKQAIISEETINETESGHQEDSTAEPRQRRPESKKDSISRSLSSSDGKNTREMEVVRMSSQSNPSERNGAGVNSVAVKRGMILPFTPLAMSFDSVNYYVDMPSEMKDQGVAEDRLQLLREVTGSFRPGILTALMGVSGAGKTTLMDVLAGRKTGGYIEGDIRISGFPKKQETFARISGYCEQTDIHSPQVTVKESLIYSAFLRLPREVSKEEKMSFVDEVMELVELDNLKDAIVGLPGATGLSTEQRKRAAAIVMRTVRNTVDTGRTVVCTIHQPSIDIFEAFDELLLMKRGGQVIYLGPLGRNSHKIIEYFEAIPGVPKIKEKYNPATWMLEVSSIAAEIQLGVDFAEHYKSSSLYERNKALVKELSTPPPGASDLYFASIYSQSTWGQFKSCLWKQWWTYWRSPDYNLVRFFFTLITALIVGTIFWKVGSKRESSNDLTVIIGAMYSSVFFIGVNNCSTVQPIITIERSVFYREKAAGMYSALPYALAQ
ncbi:hypothetical protein GH714_035632 [Hevea brasiliensis]|uniref:ABC transporter domain-containing protein n=1 Tax=Hevea brasiliensis TaxID=3981 RepID=A0A6A6NCL1_HEVBR|nr:hypothetical protein GH714_035632 [Hevea brasiliensis]